MIRFRAAVFVSALAGFFIACSSATDAGGGKQDSFDPLISVQTLEVPRARPSSARQFTTMVKIAVTNRSSEQITVERIDLESVGSGPFTIAPSSRTFNQVLDSRGEGIFQVFAQASVDQNEADVARSEGVVVIRGNVGSTLRSHFLDSARWDYFQENGCPAVLVGLARDLRSPAALGVEFDADV